jgi:hypothetical protein
MLVTLQVMGLIQPFFNHTKCAFSPEIRQVEIQLNDDKSSSKEIIIVHKLIDTYLK